MERRNHVKIVISIAFAGMILSISGCRSDRDVPGVAHLDGSFALVRTEQILFGLDTLASDAEMENAFSGYPVFRDLYLGQIMAAPGDTTATWRELVRNPFLRAIADSVSARYAEMDDLRADFSTAFQYLQYYFPGNRVPNVYTLISGFGFFPFIFEDQERDGLGVSLEMFLGSDFPYRSFTGNNPVFSDYLVRTFNREHLVKKTLDVLVDDLTGPPAGDRLLDLMLHNGIKLYILEHLQPSMPDTVLFEFTQEQLTWCTQNERNLWAHFLSEDLLYSSEKQKIQRLVNPAPSIPGMPAEAPGGVANWTGWRIIHALTERDPSIRLVDLIAMQDAQLLLENARYRPK